MFETDFPFFNTTILLIGFFVELKTRKILLRFSELQYIATHTLRQQEQLYKKLPSVASNYRRDSINSNDNGDSMKVSDGTYSINKRSVWKTLQNSYAPGEITKVTVSYNSQCSDSSDSRDISDNIYYNTQIKI